MDTMLLGSTVIQTGDVATWIENADPGAPVPTCPRWTLADLVEHIGASQRWVTKFVVDTISDPGVAFSIGWEQAPADRSAWSDWLRDGAEGVAAAFAAGTDGRAVFYPSGDADGVTFWCRRTFGEITVHRIDAAVTLDRTYAIDGVLAAAAIDDWLGTMASSGWAANVPGFAGAMRGQGQTIAWVAEDVDSAWFLRRTEAPLVLTHDRGAADVTIHGPANELLQIVSRRRPLDAAEACRVDGDRAELVHLINQMNWVGAA
jgi:uncharacterized protein (TIGR03083 family)